MLEIQPIAYMSSGAGSSFAADFCATSRMLLPVSMAISIALIDLGRPTKSGITMCGKTTTSLRGSSGNWIATADNCVVDMALLLARVFRGHGACHRTVKCARELPCAPGYSNQSEPATLG